MKRVAMAVALAVAMIARADMPGDDSIRFFLEKADVVLLADLTEQTVSYEPTQTIYRLKFTTHTGGVLHGKGPHGEPIRLDLTHPDDLRPGDRALSLTKGTTYILFLKWPSEEGSNLWRQADPWFAVMPMSSGLMHTVRRISMEERTGQDRAQQGGGYSPPAARSPKPTP